MSRALTPFALLAALASCGRSIPEPGSAPESTAATVSNQHEPERATKPASFGLTKADLRRAGADEKVIEKLAKSPFRYYRMLAKPTEDRTCGAFADLRHRLPVVAIHGDAHVGQFTVTRDTFGLEDFDRAGFGPAAVDLVRYAASIHMACRETTAWKCDGDAAVERFMTTYRAALDAPPAGNPPSVVGRLRARAPQDRKAWLSWASMLTTPVSATEDDETRGSWAEFASLSTEIRPDRALSNYEVVGVGSLRMGFGSALEEKFLFRVQGPSRAPDDDWLVEARAGEAPEQSACVWRPDYGPSFVLLFMSILGRRMPDIYGFIPLKGDQARDFWVQSWDPGYTELGIADVQSQADLEELGADAANQLAGHFWTRFPEPIRLQQRHAQLKAFDLTRSRVLELALEVARESYAGWTRFRAE